jgi:hypothetical protein
MRKIFKKIHLWLSVPVGVFVVIICITGALMVFEKDITEMLSPSLYKVENVGDRRLNPSELLEKVNAQTDENLTVTSLEYSGQPDGTTRISYREKGKEQLFVDPYTGQVKGWGSTPAFFATVKKTSPLADGCAIIEGGRVRRTLLDWNRCNGDVRDSDYRIADMDSFKQEDVVDEAEGCRKQRTPEIFV